ncbi:DUF4129 domain-containing transglutaminase family protein [Paenibacillus glucanolyticus]|nr:MULTISPECIES: transglutaminase domain-containing protein [Paenibacillus]MDH6672989.1 transglutaminase-like putative cysteine protease [Paenibacillus sp. LBL]
MRLWLDKLSTTFFSTLAMLWLWIMGMQWVSFTETIWLSETTAIVIAALTITAVIEALLPIKQGYRLLIQFVLILYCVYSLLKSYGNPVPVMTSESVLAEEIMYLFPYLWFAVAAWAIFLFIAHWAKTKGRVLFIVGLNVISFAVLDSFTKIVLWDEIAWVVGAGMGWLVSSHFNRFRRRFPQGWINLSKYPFKIIANILVIFSLIIVAGVNMPHVQPTLTDPYTAWREWSGVPLSTGSTTGTGTLIESSSESMSGYGREDNDLGGGFNFDYSPVMSITSDERSYWRGETRAVYSGTGWADGASSRRSGTGVEIGEELPGESNGSLSTKKLEQSVTMLSDTVYPVLFGAYSVKQLEGLDEDIDPGRLRWQMEGAEMHLDDVRDADYPKSYTLTSEVPVIPIDELSTRTYDQLYSGSMDDAYIQKPRNFPERVTTLAEEITAEGDTPYEKVMLLQQYLTSNYTYTNTPDLTRKKSDDFVDGFLFEVKEGYCDYFSTSLVMMTRSLDIPARWVKGYAPGSLTASEYMPMDGQTPIEPGNYTVTNADAHSWVEVYFGEYGWVPIEATPGFSMPILTADTDAEPVIEEDVEEEESAEDETTPASASNDQQSGWVKMIVTAAAVVIVLWILYILWRMRISLRFAGARIRAGKPLTAADKVIAETERWIRSVHRKGLVRQEHETLRESVKRWLQAHPALESEMRPLLQQFEAARYSPAEVQEEQWRSVQNDAEKLKKSIKKIRIVHEKRLSP